MDAEWIELCEVLKSTGSKLLHAAPDEETRVDGLAYLARTSAKAIENRLMLRERQTNGLMVGVGGGGGTNPDFRYSTAAIQPDKRYRITGKLNDAYRVALSLYTTEPDGGFIASDFKVFNEGDPELDKDGNFDVEISPEGSTGPGLKSKPTTNTLLVRDIVLKKGGIRPDYTFEAKTAGEAGEEFSAAAVLQSFNKIKELAGPTEQFLTWTNHFASKPNMMEPIRRDFDEKLQGDPTCQYFTGYFHLESHQSLLIEIPDLDCDYWSVMLASHWQEPLPMSHLNHYTSKKDEDGTTRLVIAPRDPSCRNWLSTEGRSRGVIWHRRINSSNTDIPRCTLQG